MESNIGIISGSGSLPLIIGKNLINKGYSIHFFCINGFADLKLYKNYNNISINLTSFTEILKILSANKINRIILVGKISRPSIKDIKFDFKTISLIKDYFLESKGDDQLLKLISNFFLKNGFPLFNWKETCNELFSSKDHLTKIKPSNIAIKNLKKGLNIFQKIGKADIGQSMIIQNQLILGVECIEGTDELINRCNYYKKDGDNGILLKLSKYGQHSELDIPTIGIDTLKLLKDNKYDGLFIEKNNCVILEKDEIINFCNKNKIFLSTVKKID